MIWVYRNVLKTSKIIVEDYGEEGLKKAVIASSKHAAYYAALGRGRLAYVEKIVEEYSNKE